jgi:predicted ATPase
MRSISIQRRSAGNPFFAEELVAASAGTVDERLPVDLRDVLLARVSGLSEEAQELLGTAAVSGPGVDHDLLAAVAGRGEAALTSTLREAIESQLIVATDLEGEPGYAFRHALVQEAVYDDLLPWQRRAWHAGYVAALERRPIPEGAAGASHLAALAHHAAAAHDVPRALDAWIRAARASARAYAMAESARACERALELWDAVEPDDRPADVDATQLLYEASMALIHIGDSARARWRVSAGPGGSGCGGSKVRFSRRTPPRPWSSWAAGRRRPRCSRCARTRQTPASVH